MREFAKADFRLGARQPDGCSLREHLQAAYRQTGVMPEELKVKPLPDLVSHIWEWFLELHFTRGNNGFGPSPLTHAEIKAWSSLRRITLDPWSLSAILTLDRDFIAWAAEEAAKRES